MTAPIQPIYPVIKVGGFYIRRHDDKSIWIQPECGEGGQFSEELLELAIYEFFKTCF